MNTVKSLFLFCLIILLSITGMAKMTVVDSLELNNSKLILYLSNGQKVHKKLFSKHGKLIANHNGTKFIVMFDSIIQNSLAIDIAKDMKQHKEYKYSEPMIEQIGYIVYNGLGDIYFVNHVETKRQSLIWNEIKKHISKRLEIKQGRTVFITIVLNNP